MRRLRSLPIAVRFVLTHGAIGFLVGGVFVAALLLLGDGGFGRLLWQVGGVPAVAMLWFFSGLTFGSALIGGAVMMMGQEDEAGPRRGR
ncbi:MAG TPA: hypothetical protein VD970_02155, partial [Acetobacteraceae bacterium]|nr:hypothetical protein [Acetobacteraceae bacterium]